MLLPKATRVLSGWNHYPMQPCTVIRPEFIHQLDHIDRLQPTSVHRNTPLLARGSGCSYGDAALSEKSHLIDTSRWQRLLDFNPNTGQITAEAGMRLSDLLDFCVPRGWFIPVTPGTQQVSLGGCVAANVHGKNQPSMGNFAQCVLSLSVYTGIGHQLCSGAKSSDLFWATLGGMGLTGIITHVTLQLMPLQSTLLEVTRTTCRDLNDVLSLFTIHTAHPYQMAWLDFSSKSALRSVFFAARHRHGNVDKRQKHSRPAWMGNLLHTLPLNISTARAFNYFYFQRHKRPRTCLQTYTDFFYPLDRIRNWPRLYGKTGFIQYQFCAPQTSFHELTEQIIQRLHAANYFPYLAVLKRFADHPAGPLSFPQPGFTLALDIALDKQQQLLPVLSELDHCVIEHQGRTYLAKDTHLGAASFRKMYPQWRDWLAIKRRYDPQDCFQSSLSQRLELDYASE